MGGFDTDAVRTGFGLADTLTPVVVLAVGRQDGAAGLPAPLAAREAAPADQAPGQRPAAARPGRAPAGGLRGLLIPNGRVSRTPAVAAQVT
jgi:hypothetical protein